jgi:hypothetical protein
MNKLSKVLLGTFASFALASSIFCKRSRSRRRWLLLQLKKLSLFKDLALSIEAFTEEELEKNLIKDASDLQEVVPRTYR